MSLSALLAVSACTVTNNQGTSGQCSLDSTVACAATATGYSCNAADVTPTQSNSSLSCGAPVKGSDGRFDYCCAPAGTDTCSVDSTVKCTAGTGYTCTGAAAPTDNDATLSCGAGTNQTNGRVTYCCSTAPTTTCSTDQSVSCASGTGYSCSGYDTPSQADPSLVCSGGAVDGNLTDYCCDTASCSADSNVSCSGGASGYTCTGTDTPNQSDSSLVCSSGTPNGSATDYCCITYSSSDCLEDPSVQGCQAGSYGFSCTNGATPDQADPSLTCSAGVAGSNGQMLFCCTK